MMASQSNIFDDLIKSSIPLFFEKKNLIFISVGSSNSPKSYTLIK